MKKPERLNDLIHFLNDRNSFNLHELIEKYHISRSTALRDIQSLEAIGMPIYSQVGRNGYYGILPNRLLSPILFTVDEMYALFFCMLTLDVYQSTPFHLCLQTLRQKFELCLSEERINRLRRMEDIIHLNAVKHPNESPFLRTIVDDALEGKVVTVQYRKDTNLRRYDLQFIDISSTYGQWYTRAYNFESKKVQVLRVDKITAISETTRFTPLPPAELQQISAKPYKDPASVDFIVEVTARGADLYYKENYPSMNMNTEDGRHFITGFYNPGEEDFIAQYILSFTNHLLSVEPDHLRNLLEKKLADLNRHYGSILQ